MRPIQTKWIWLFALFLAACQTETEPGMPQQPPPADACGAAQYQHLIGTIVDPAQFSGHTALRIIPPGSAVTMDYRPDRLNVETDATDRITRIACG